MSDFQIHHAGDHALCLQFQTEISEATNALVIAYKNFITQAIIDQKITGIIEIIPTYCTLLIYYNPLILPLQQLCDYLEALALPKQNTQNLSKKIYSIPVCYDEPFCLDIKNVAAHAQMSTQDVINLHSAELYLVYMLGFVAGFPYLGGLNHKITTPRLKQPRTKIEAGSVGIADTQTGIYPIDSPGGWQIIGKTPLKLFNSLKENPVLLKAGIYLKFEPISLQVFKEIKEQVDCDCYEFKEIS